jgi:DNA repair photolyase
MFTTWNGEFLISPVPLELSTGACSHGCAYCFSRANGYCGKNWTGGDRFAKKVERIFTGETNNAAAKLLRAGYPVNLSNRSDPFASSNKKDILTVIRALRKHDVPLHISTKGGPLAQQSISLVGPSVWYISISFQDDFLRSKYEPGAPTIESRFELIDAVVKSGSRVIVGCNPLVKEWIGDYKTFLIRLKELGVSGVYYQPYHTNSDQWKGMSDRERELLSPWRDDAKKRISPKHIWNFLDTFRDFSKLIGMETYITGQQHISNFWDCMDIYPKRFGVEQYFINWCFQNLKNNSIVTFENWYSIVSDGLPEGLWELDHQVHSVARNIGMKIPRYMTYRDLLKIIWSERKHGMCPANMEIFSYVAEDIGGQLHFVRDDEKLPIMLFNRNGFASYFVTKGGESIETH